MFKVGDLIVISNRALETHFAPNFFHGYFKNGFAVVKQVYDDYLLASVCDDGHQYTQYFDNCYCSHYEFKHKDKSLEERIDLFSDNLTGGQQYDL